MLRRSDETRTRDRRIIALAIPALGALAAEPTYLLFDTAIVGHLGTVQLAGLSIAATFLASAFWLFNFLAYGTTAEVARLHGAGRRDEATAVAGQAVLLALGIGVVIVLVGEALATQIVAMLNGSGAVARKAETYLRISFLGAPFVMLVFALEGYLRGVQRMTTPLKILVASNAANVVLELLFVYGFEWDVAGSAWGTVIAQAGAAAAFAAVLAREHAARLRFEWARMRGLIRLGGDLMVRVASLLLTFNITVALLAAKGPVGLAAHQVIMQVFFFIALTLDSLAIAAQTLIGNELGAGRTVEAKSLARRIVQLAAIAGVTLSAVLLAAGGPLAHLFTSDDAVIDQISRAWWLFALMQPVYAAVFAWDGILMGARDTRFLMFAMLTAAAVCVPVAAVTIDAGLGILGAWIGLSALIAVRFVSNGVRVASGLWAGA